MTQTPAQQQQGVCLVLCSVGAHVRDAAAYVCWAFARAYTATDLAASISVLAPALLVTACYDREVCLFNMKLLHPCIRFITIPCLTPPQPTLPHPHPTPPTPGPLFLYPNLAETLSANPCCCPLVPLPPTPIPDEPHTIVLLKTRQAT